MKTPSLLVHLIDRIWLSVILWMDGHNGKPSWHKEWSDYQKIIQRQSAMIFFLPLIHSHVSFHQLKALK